MKKYKDTSVEKKKWYKDTPTIIAIATSIATIILTIIVIIEKIQVKPKKIQENTEIVLDRSDDMGESFDGRTKWNAAVSAIEVSLEYQVAQHDNLALRIFGGSCLDEDNTKLLVGFDQDNKGKVRNALKNVKLVGKPTLVSALIDATGDFNDPERFGGVNKRIIAITGSYESCYSNVTQHISNHFLLERLQDRIEAEERIKVDIYIVGIGIPPNQREKFEKITKITGGTVYYADSQEIFEGILKNIGTVAYGAKITIPYDITPPSPPSGLSISSPPSGLSIQ